MFPSYVHHDQREQIDRVIAAAVALGASTNQHEHDRYLSDLRSAVAALATHLNREPATRSFSSAMNLAEVDWATT